LEDVVYKWAFEEKQEIRSKNQEVKIQEVRVK
ncbi:MAG: hypothetical protein JWR09_5735, partial [Mucilaginibacter sp.]|nr:hypothetical protein [Mucilaginibacter sp.]